MTAAVVGLLGAMLALMWRPMQEESDTLDEPVFLAAGYSYWLGHRHTFNVEHPPLLQLWSALPLLGMPVNLPPNAEQYFDYRLHPPQSLTWKHEFEDSAKLFPHPIAFYNYPVIEAGLFARRLLFHPFNNAAALLFWSRFMQALVTLAAGLVIFFWARALSNDAGGVLALATWVFNPLALAFGHLVLTDPGMALALPLAVWTLARFLESPTWPRTLIAGLATGLALATKFTALLLVPIFGTLLVLWWWKTGRWRIAAGHLAIVAVVAWVVVLLVYCPHWSPPPPISAEDAARLKVPAWLVALRPVLIPGEYFKGLAIMLLHASTGHLAYLAGEWSQSGWWYYFPVALLVKTPLALLLLCGTATAWAVWRCRQWRFAELVPLVAAAVYLGAAMMSRTNIGVRHVLPVFPLLAAVVAVQYARAARAVRLTMGVLAGGLALTAWLACPLYLQYFNELAGGPAEGHKWLVDSNLDWGQDAKRLKAFVDQNKIAHVYVRFFGTAGALQTAGVKCTHVTTEQARQIRGGHLVVSASYLMQPEWDWLRTTHEPVARVAHTLFVYRLP